MRLLPSRLVTVIALGVVTSIAVAQAAVGDMERDLVARMTRAGVQRHDADGSHGSTESGDVTSVAAASPTPDDAHVVAGSAPAVIGRAAFDLATSFVWLPQLSPTSHTSLTFAPAPRGRAPPSA